MQLLPEMLTPTFVDAGPMPYLPSGWRFSIKKLQPDAASY